MIGFGPVERYKKLRQFYQKHGIVDEAVWLDKRISAIEK